MRIQFIILTLITNFAFGQKSKVIIDKNTVKYEKVDEYYKFDDIKPKFKTDQIRNKEFKILSKTESEIELYTIYNSGYGGEEVSIVINQKLEIVNVDFLSWSDVIDISNPIEYRVSNINLSLNQNPFNNTSELRGKYLLEIQHIDKSNKIVKTEIYKGKFKTYEGIPKGSADYKWAVEQNLIFHDIIDRNGNYLNPDRKAVLKDNGKKLIKEINKISNNIPYKIRTKVVVNKFGRIEEVLEFNTPMDFDLKLKVVRLIKKYTEWYPACFNDMEVKTTLPFIIGME